MHDDKQGDSQQIPEDTNLISVALLLADSSGQITVSREAQREHRNIVVLAEALSGFRNLGSTAPAQFTGTFESQQLAFSIPRFGNSVR